MSENLPDPEIIERLEAGLHGMPKLRREIFLAVRLDDLPYSEIAGRTGLSVEQVEGHFAESMLAISDALDGRNSAPRWKRILRRVVERWRR